MLGPYHFAETKEKRISCERGRLCVEYQVMLSQTVLEIPAFIKGLPCLCFRLPAQTT